METFELEKPVWDDRDFSTMGWHDAIVWSMLANPAEFEFLLDLDYIFKWVHPEKRGGSFKFWIGPVTLVFENASAIKIDIESSRGTIEVDGLYRENPNLSPNRKFTRYTYRFDCQEGDISVEATGFKMFVRRKPELIYRRFEFPQSLRGFGRILNAV